MPELCEQCRNTGWCVGIVDDRRGAISRPCTCAIGKAITLLEVARRLENRQKHLAWAAIPPRFASARLEDFDNVPVGALEALDGQGVIITGKPGVGKTHLAVALLVALLEQGRWGFFADTSTLLDRIRACYHPDGPVSADEMLAAVVEAEVLLLDDLAVEHMTPWVREKLYQIVNTRYLYQRQSLVTTNLTMKVLSQRVGDRIVSRLHQLCVVVEMTGQDRRLAWPT